MSDNKLYPVPEQFAKRTLLNREKYEQMYKQSIDDPDTFWGEHGKRLDWIKPYTRVKNSTYDYDKLSIKWYEDGVLNASANCLDRHLEKRGDQTAIIFEGDDPAESRNVTYRELHAETSRFANVLKSLGVRRVTFGPLWQKWLSEVSAEQLSAWKG